MKLPLNIIGEHNFKSLRQKRNDFHIYPLITKHTAIAGDELIIDFFGSGLCVIKPDDVACLIEVGLTR